MIKFVAKRTLQIIPTLLILSLVTFFAGWVMRFGELTAKFQNQSVLSHYWEYLKNLLNGNLGTFFKSGNLIIVELSIRYPLTLSIALGGIFVATVIGIFLGIISAVYQNKFIDKVIMILSLTATSIPLFFLALLLMLFFTVYLGWLPSLATSSWKGLIMPIFTLGLPAVGFVTKTTRTAMLDCLNKDYVRALKARGVSDIVIIFYHCLKNILIPVMTAIGVKFGELLAGTILVENAFSIPGMGRLLIDSINLREIHAICACVLVLATTFAIINIIIDILYILVDPRVDSFKATGGNNEN